MPRPRGALARLEGVQALLRAPGVGGLPRLHGPVEVVMATVVVNVRKTSEYDVYVGRPSKWGNPFSIGKDGTRDEVIEKYRAWVGQQAMLMAGLHELKGKVLGCWCYPAPCHAEVLAELADGE